MKFYEEYLLNKWEKQYRVNQVHQAVYKDLVSSFEEITTLSKKLRDELSNNLSFSPLKVLQEKTSKEDGTVKVLFETHDKHKIESVLMRHLYDRNTVCISSQVGCPMGCKFCATGKLGIIRNLTSDEIVAQVLYFKRKLKHEENKTITNVVYMWMGEPLINYNEFIESVRTINNPKKVEIWIRHITVSTCGIIPGIEKLMEEGLQINLAISLHAPTNELRSKLMPVNNQYPIEELIPVLKKYSQKSTRKIFYEYVMLKWVNDSSKCAKELGDLLQGSLSHVNLIPFNSWGNNEFQCSSRNKMHIFQKILLEYGVVSTIRVSLGQDIDGACWQLAWK